MSTNKITFIKLLSVILIIIASQNIAISQAWKESLPQDREAQAKLTLFDYQKAFNDYWEPLNVENGYYTVEGEKVKAGGWKQFKRWEYYWDKRVNPVTGEFPEVSAMERFGEYLKTKEGQRSISGNWTSMGPTSSTGGYAGIGRLNCVGFHPTDNNKFYVGAASGGIWKTTDGGTSWTAIGDDNAALGVSDIIVIDDVSDDIIYIATGDRDASDTYSVGVLKSTDGGSTWNTTGLSWTQNQYYIINRLIMDPNDNNIMYAATNGGLYKTTNGAVSWSQISSTTFKDLEFNPSNSAMLYASDGWGEIYRSTNSGASWTSVHLESGGRNTRIAVSPDNSSNVYVVMANSNSGLHGIFKSTDSGATYSQVFSGATANLMDWACDGSGSGGQGWYDLCLAADPNDADVLFVGGVNTWKSTDGGSTWNISNHWSGTCGGQATTVHADKHYLAYQNGSSTLFECNDGGIYKTSNSGSSWTDITNTIVISQIYRIGVAQSVSNDVICGLQDNGTKNQENGIWDDVIGGDGMDCAIDPNNADIQYGELYYGNIKKTTNHWISYNTISNGISGSGAWVTPYVIDPNNSQILYVGYADLHKSTNQGSSWTQISSWGGSKLKSLAVAPSNSQYIYTATNTTMYKTSDGGTNWTDITSGLPVSNGNITFISIKNDDPNTVWVSISGFNSDGVYQTTNGGSSWTNISSGLPQLPVNNVIQNRLNTTENELYAATDVGVYVKVGSANWAAFYSGLPNVNVREVEIYYDDAVPSNSKIRAGTYGRGLWESDLYTPPSPPVSDFIADNTTPTTVDTVHFTDLTTNNPTSWAWTITPTTFTYIEGTDANSQNPIAIFNDPGFYTVELTTTNANGSSTETKVDYINCSQAAPVADFEADNLTPDTETTVNFTDLSQNSPDSWVWSFNPGTITYEGGTDENSQNPSVIFTQAGLYTVTLTASNVGGSDDETKTDYVDVSPAVPVADFEADNLTPSVNMDVTFTDLSTNFPDTWLWVFTPSTVNYLNGTDENSQNPVVEFTATGLYTVSLTASNAGGSDQEEKIDYIDVTNALSVTASATPEIICFGESSQLNAEAGGGSETYTYSWTSDPAGFVSDIQNPVVMPEVTTIYTVQVDDGITIVSDDIEVTVNQLPQITLVDWPETLCNQLEPAVQLLATPEGGTFSGNVTEDGIFTPESAPLGWNVITYTYEDENSCINSATDSIYVDNCVGISNNKPEGLVNIYPNPNNGSFKIYSAIKIKSLEIINHQGKVVYTETPDNKEVKINAKITKGIYIIRMKLQDNSILNKSIIIN